ncbi:methylmalonyl-CoA mutase family protein [Spirosoma montaniterrae]|uniref:Methylmalonyl-CoA mutase n=1 Tax=Spirosoma montaniterrae TaxID=1178516 RepID=A0A1P9X3L0_9BACT|nr:methylmalonyl-CoA mutase family protein [Spirosoma montaniterrae]AQG82226.1 methylmalonyl-CoA mutase [Spirosoma montaniterrae]
MEPLSSPAFPPASKLDWLAQVRRELKDERADELLRWHTPEGFTIDPYYTADDLNSLAVSDLQDPQKAYPGWLNTPEYTLTNDPRSDNRHLRHALERGADALLLNLPTQPDLARLLDGIKLSDTPVFFRLAGDASAFVRALQTVAPYQLKGGLLTNNANLEATQLTLDSPQFRTLGISSHDFHNAGATATQELAFTLARLAERFDSLTATGLQAEQIIQKTVLSVSVGTSYFLEIAKLRALRVLIQRFYQRSSFITHHSSLVHCQTSSFYNATATPYSNLLRATTEAMAAVVGGCDALTVQPYDTLLNAPNEFSERIARNVSVLLRDESYFDKVADPSAGSYYIETLTHELTERAWALFGQVQGMGGLAKAFEMGFIQAEIERAYQAKRQAVRDGRVLVGVNKYRFDEADNAIGEAVTLFRLPLSTLPDRRLAAEFE